MIFVPFNPEHLRLIEVQESQLPDLMRVSPQEVSELAKGREAWSGFVGGRCLGAAGIIDVPGWPNRSVAWAIFGRDIRQFMVSGFRFIKSVVDSCPRRRIEMTVECDFKQGHRFAKMLGFTVEAPRMVAYSHYGTDMALYAKVRY